MTLEEVNKLEWRELDAAIAEHVLGLKPCTFREMGTISGLHTLWQCEHRICETCFPTNEEAIKHRHSPLHRYSEDIKAAWEVMDRMSGVEEPWGLFEPDLFCSKLDNRNWVFRLRSTCGSVVEIEAESPPLAICRGALMMVSIRDEGEGR